MTRSVREFNPARVEAPVGFADFRWPDAWASPHTVDVEIGCGVGWHPIRYALGNPARKLVAIEHTRTKFAKFESRVQTHLKAHGRERLQESLNAPNAANQKPSQETPATLENLLPVHADAIRWITHAFARPGAPRIARAMILYPNPEPKAANKRWIRMPFFRHLLGLLVSGGEIVIATNEAAYMDEVIDFAQYQWKLSVIEARTFSRETASEGIPRTHFERKYLLNGQTCFDVRLLKP